jgi:hypothetical protein
MAFRRFAAIISNIRLWHWMFGTDYDIGCSEWKVAAKRQNAKIINYAHTLKKYVYCQTCIEVKNLWGFVPFYRTKKRLGRDLLNLFRFVKPARNRKGSSPGYRFGKPVRNRKGSSPGYRFGKPVRNGKGSSPGYRFGNKPIFLECMGRLDRIDPVRSHEKN